MLYVERGTDIPVSMEMADELAKWDERLIDVLKASKRVVVLTGAGVSAESGVPTFRDALAGLWAKFDAEELATPRAFARDPQLVSRWYDERRCHLKDCRPNAGHFALARHQRIVEASGGEVTLVTQNVDRLHQAAGSREVIELHGSLWVWRCEKCRVEAEERGPAFQIYPPRCDCGGIKRPGVVWFGEALPADALRKAERSAAECDLLMSIGTSSVVYPAAGLIESATSRGINTLEINPHPTLFSRKMCWSIRGASALTLPGLVDGAFGKELGN